MTPLAAIAAVAIAGVGLQAWKKELRGRTEYDLARRILVGVYRVRTAIDGVRNPFMSAAEWADRPNRDEEALASTEDLSHAYDKRFHPLNEALVDLHADLLEAEAVWADRLRGAFQSLDASIRELRRGLMQYLWLHGGRLKDDDAGTKQKEAEKLVLAGVEPGVDLFRDNLQKAISQFESELRPELGAPN